MAADLLASSGAISVYALITHGILSGDALDMINQSVVDRVVVTNTAPQEANLRRSRKLEVIDVAPVFAEAIRRSYDFPQKHQDRDDFRLTWMILDTMERLSHYYSTLIRDAYYTGVIRVSFDHSERPKSKGIDCSQPVAVGCVDCP